MAGSLLQQLAHLVLDGVEHSLDVAEIRVRQTGLGLGWLGVLVVEALNRQGRGDCGVGGVGGVHTRRASCGCPLGADNCSSYTSSSWIDTRYAIASVGGRCWLR